MYILYFIRSLTENQKIELHSKALKYLRQHTKRCMACGEIQFTRLLGKTVAQETRRTKLTVDVAEMHQLEKATYTLKENGIVSRINLELYLVVK